MMSEYFPLLPTAVLVLQVIFDMFFIESYGFKKPVKFDPNTLVAGSFIFAFALFMSAGIGQGIKFLVMSGTSDTFAQVFAVISLFAGYQLAKAIDKQRINQISNEDTRQRYLKIRHYLGYTSSGVAFFIICIFVFLFVTYRLRSQAQQNINNIPDSSMNLNYISPTKTQTPTIPTQEVTPTDGTSYGIFYPFSQDVTINTKTPTIIGKISQTENIYFKTKFGAEISPVDLEEYNIVRFLPGKISDLTIKIDGIEIKDIYGIPQFPTITCKDSNWQAENKSQNENIFATEKGCLDNKKSEIPPLVFFAKTVKPLSPGLHTLTIESNTTYKPMTFTVDSSYHLSTQTIYSISAKDSWKYPLIHSVSCAPGYYYDKNYINMPLPSFDNPNLFYGISFPQSKAELGNQTTRRVKISFDEASFDLFFPAREIFYEGESVRDSKELYLPQDMLVFGDGQKAKYTSAYNIIPQDGNYAVGYYEIYPIDIAGGKYKDFSIPRTLSGSSGCDG